MKKVSIFEHSDLTGYMAAFIKAKEAQASAYSFRALAMKLETISYSQLYQIISGKKKFPVSLINEFCSKVLKLNRQELKYFKALVEINHLMFDKGSDEVLERAKKKLQDLRPLEIKHIEFTEITSKPLTMIIFEMLNRIDLKNVSQLKPDLLYQQYSQQLIDQSIDYLKESGHISISPCGEITRLVPNLMSSNDIPSQHIRNYHKEVSSYVPQIIDDVGVDMREFQSFVLNIKTEDMPKAKELVRNFLHEFARQMEATSSTANSTYNLNLQFFPLTKEIA